MILIREIFLIVLGYLPDDMFLDENLFGKTMYKNIYLKIRVPRIATHILKNINIGKRSTVICNDNGYEINIIFPRFISSSPYCLHNLEGQTNKNVLLKSLIDMSHAYMIPEMIQPKLNEYGFVLEGPIINGNIEDLYEDIMKNCDNLSDSIDMKKYFKKVRGNVCLLNDKEYIYVYISMFNYRLTHIASDFIKDVQITTVPNYDEF